MKFVLSDMLAAVEKADNLFHLLQAIDMREYKTLHISKEKEDAIVTALLNKSYPKELSTLGEGKMTTRTGKSMGYKTTPDMVTYIDYPWRIYKGDTWYTVNMTDMSLYDIVANAGINLKNIKDAILNMDGAYGIRTAKINGVYEPGKLWCNKRIVDITITEIFVIIYNFLAQNCRVLQNGLIVHKDLQMQLRQLPKVLLDFESKQYMLPNCHLGWKFNTGTGCYELDDTDSYATVGGVNAEYFQQFVAELFYNCSYRLPVAYDGITTKTQKLIVTNDVTQLLQDTKLANADGKHLNRLTVKGVLAGLARLHKAHDTVYHSFEKFTPYGEDRYETVVYTDCANPLKVCLPRGQYGVPGKYSKETSALDVSYYELADTIQEVVDVVGAKTEQAKPVMSEQDKAVNRYFREVFGNPAVTLNTIKALSDELLIAMIEPIEVSTAKYDEVVEHYKIVKIALADRPAVAEAIFDAIVDAVIINVEEFYDDNCNQQTVEEQF